MLKLTSLLLFIVIVIAGCATTSKLSALHIDATNISTFEASVATFQRSLSPDSRLRFEVALQEIWGATEFQVGAEGSPGEKNQRYFARLDGLGYYQVIRLAGPAAEQTYLALVAQKVRERTAFSWGGPNFADSLNPPTVFSR